MYYVGIDPGVEGAIAVIHQDEQMVAAYKFEKKDPVGREKTLSWLLEFPKDGVVFCIEDVRGMPGQAHSSTAKLMRSVGFWEGFCTGAGFRYYFVKPQTWQKVLDNKPSKKPLPPKATDKQKRKRNADHRKNLKNAIMDFVLRTVENAPEWIKLKKHSDIADAACIAISVKRSL